MFLRDNPISSCVLRVFSVFVILVTFSNDTLFFCNTLFYFSTIFRIFLFLLLILVRNLNIDPIPCEINLGGVLTILYRVIHVLANIKICTARFCTSCCRLSFIDSESLSVSCLNHEDVCHTPMRYNPISMQHINLNPNHTRKKNLY